MRESQVTTLYNFLMTGCKIDRTKAFKWFGIADLRSRVSELESDYGITLQRETVPNKRYRQYWIKQN